ncbi:hypothetical protein Sm713_73880 [Streptomyces sp. TS71-3]|nr:hypothetical protein Sm713_73880 [Streptomyces sp. TS71-3]
MDGAATRNGTGSLNSSRPAGTVTDVLPPKVTGTVRPATGTGPLSRTATEARPTRSGAAPNAFVRRTRTELPPAPANTVLRTVWSARPRPAGQVLPGMSAPTTGAPCQAAAHGGLTGRGPAAAGA